MFALFAAAVLASPGLVQVWSIEDGRLLHTVQTDGVQHAWIADDGELTVAGGRPPKGVRHVGQHTLRGQTADGRFIAGSDSIRRSTTGEPLIDATWGYASGDGWLTVGRTSGLVEWTMTQGSARRRWLGHGGRRRMVFAPTAEGPRLVVGVVDRPTLHVFAGPDWARSQRVELPASAGELEDLAVAGEVVFALGGRTLFRFDPRDGRLDPVPGGEVDAFAVSRDGAHLVMARGGALWQATAAKPDVARRLKIEWAEHDALAISPDGRRLAVSGRPGAVRVFSTASAREIWRRESTDASSTSGLTIVYGPDLIEFAPDGTLYVDPEEGNLVAVDFSGDEPVERRLAFDDDIWPAWSGDGSAIVVDAKDGICLATDGACRVLAGFMNNPDTLALAPDGQTLAVAHSDGPVTIIRADGRAIGGEDDPPDGVVAETWNRPGSRVSLGRRLHGWSPEQAELRRSGPWLVGVSRDDRSAIALNGAVDVAMPDVSGPFALAGSKVVWAAEHAWRASSVLRAFDLATGRAIDVEPGHRHPVKHVVGSPRGRWVATADDVGRIVVWRGDTLRAAHRFETGRMVLSLTFDPLDQRLVAVLGAPAEPRPPEVRPSPVLEPLPATSTSTRHMTSNAPITALAAVGDGLLVGVGDRLMHLDRDDRITPVHDFDAPIELLATDGCRAFAVLEGSRSLNVVPLDEKASRPDPPDEAPGIGLHAALGAGPMRLRPRLPGISGQGTLAPEASAANPDATRSGPPDPAAGPIPRPADGPCPASEATVWAAPGNGRLLDLDASHPTGNLLYDARSGRVWLGTGYGIVIWDAAGEAIRIPTIALDDHPEPGRVVGLDVAFPGAHALVNSVSGAWTVAVWPDGRTGPPVHIRGLDGTPRDIVAVYMGYVVVVTDIGVYLVRRGTVQSSLVPEALRQNEPGTMIAAVARPGASHIADGWTLDALRRVRLRRGHLEVDGQTRFPEPHTAVMLSSLIRWRGGIAAAWYDDGEYGITLFDDAPR